MAELYELSRTDNDNTDPNALGAPENMPRSDTNDRIREISGALRRWYHDPEWTRLLEEQNGTAFTVAKLTDTSIRVSGGDASAFFPVGTRVRVSEDGSPSAEGYVDSVVAGPPTDVTISFPGTAVVGENPAGGSWSGLGTSGSPASDTLSNVPVVPSSINIQDSSVHTGGLSVTDNGAGVLTHAVDGNVGTINYSTGAIVVNSLSVAFDANVEIDYKYTDTVPASTNRAELYFARSVREAAFREVGTSADQLPTNADLSAVAFKEEGPSGGIDADTLDGKHAQDIIDEVTLASRNFLTNGSFRVAQRGTTITSTTAFPNSDDSYVMDRWLLLSDGNDRVDVSRSTDVPASPSVCRSSIQLEVETVTGSPNSEQFGIVQILEAKDAAPMIGRNVSFSFWAKSTGNVDFIRAAILSWTSTADSVTSDLVSSWSVGSLSGRTAANWTLEGETVQLVVDGTWSEYKLEGVALDAASAVNVAVIIWVDEQDFSAGDILKITGAQLEIGDTSSLFKDRPMTEEVQLCQRYFQKTFDWDETPVQNNGDEVGAILASAAPYIAANGGAQWRLPVHMRAAPTVTTYNPGAGDANWNSGDVPTSINAREHVIELSATTPLVSGDSIHLTADAEL